MPDTSPTIPMPVAAEGTTQAVTECAEEAGARVFPCESCGADLQFNIGAQSLKCPYCGHVKPLEADPEGEVAEQDFEALLKRLVDQRDLGRRDEDGCSEVTCDSCGATVRFTGTLTSSECAYCGAPLQLDNVHDAPHRIPVDGVLAFLIDRETARTSLRQWVRSRWFAPNEFTKRGIQGRFNGVYLPYWTFDSLTMNRYEGMRGEHYYVTVGSGKNRRTVRRTRWYPASGSFQRFFDDVMVVAGTGLPNKRLLALEPWPLIKCQPFQADLLAGFLARTYDVGIEEGFNTGKETMRQAIRAEVHRRIGGDAQRITFIDSRFDAITYKHLLLPVWMLAYRFGKKSYQVVVNAGTGEVQGDRPWSWIKITLAVAATAAIAGAIAYFAA